MPGRRSRTPVINQDDAAHSRNQARKVMPKYSPTRTYVPKVSPRRRPLIPETAAYKPLESPRMKKGSRFNLQADEETPLYRPSFDSFVSNSMKQQDNLSASFISSQKFSPQKKNEKVGKLMGQYMKSDIKSIQRQIVNHIEYTLARDRFNFDNYGAYQAAAHSVRDRLVESWNDNNLFHQENESKKVFIFSMEYMMGRTFQNALVNSDLEDKFESALVDIGYDLEELYQQETDAEMGSENIGRQAGCFLDSLATLDIPAWGYGIRYDYGMFKQTIVEGNQVEVPDYWLERGKCPWEIERQDIKHIIKFYGRIEKYNDKGNIRAKWLDTQQVIAQAYDTPIPGFNTYTTNNLRLWKSRSPNEFDFTKFNASDFTGALSEHQQSEYITSVLYPNDTTEKGKELRLKQEYFFSSASMYDIIQSYKKKYDDKFKKFAELNQIHLNDSHPAISSVELLRILVDEEMLSFEEAWKVTYQTFSYACYATDDSGIRFTSCEILQKLLPRHLDLIFAINQMYVNKLEQKYPGDYEKMQKMSLIEEGYPKQVRMSHLAIVCSHTVNGVSQDQTLRLQTQVFKEFNTFFPGKIVNKTGGVTPRRWLHCCNPNLSNLIDQTLGGTNQWITDLSNLQILQKFSKDPNFTRSFSEIKKQNKLKLKKWVLESTGVNISLDALYDVHVAPIKDHKRQLMNILYVIYRYKSILECPSHLRSRKFTPRVVMIGGKAAPNDLNGKATIKLISAVSERVNKDVSIKGWLQVVFLPNYNVSAAQVIIPGADVSQHISTAGTDAGETSNMKALMNGCLILGTAHGSNLEIAQEIGQENMFLFGENYQGVCQIRNDLKNQKRGYVGSRLQNVFDQIKLGNFGDLKEAHKMIDDLCNGGDVFVTCFDFYAYIESQTAIDEAYRNPQIWNQMAVNGIAKSGKFSSDRSILEYCSQIWEIQPVQIPKPNQHGSQKIKPYLKKSSTILLDQSISSPSPTVINSPSNPSNIAAYKPKQTKSSSHVQPYNIQELKKPKSPETSQQQLYNTCSKSIELVYGQIKDSKFNQYDSIRDSACMEVESSLRTNTIPQSRQDEQVIEEDFQIFIQDQIDKAKLQTGVNDIAKNGGNLSDRTNPTLKRSKTQHEQELDKEKVSKLIVQNQDPKQEEKKDEKKTMMHQQTISRKKSVWEIYESQGNQGLSKKNKSILLDPDQLSSNTSLQYTSKSLYYHQQQEIEFKKTILILGDKGQGKSTLLNILTKIILIAVQDPINQNEIGFELEKNVNQSRLRKRLFTGQEEEVFADEAPIILNKENVSLFECPSLGTEAGFQLFSDILEASDQYKFVMVVTQEALQKNKTIESLEILVDALEDIDVLEDKISLIVTKVDFTQGQNSVKQLLQNYIIGKKDLSDGAKKMIGFFTKRDVFLIHMPIAPGQSIAYPKLIEKIDETISYFDTEYEEY